MAAVIINLIIFFCTLIFVLSCFRREGKWDPVQGGKALRFFTLLSNMLCALSSLLLVTAAAGGHVPFPVWLLRYIATAGVTVTLATVMIYLGPAAGYKAMLSGRDLYFHLIGPVLSVISFCFMERFFSLTLPLSLTGVLPVAVYGGVYLYKVVLGPEKGRWEDFYGYNRDGKWRRSLLLMILMTVLLCILLWGLTRMGPD